MIGMVVLFPPMAFFFSQHALSSRCRRLGSPASPLDLANSCNGGMSGLAGGSTNVAHCTLSVWSCGHIEVSAASPAAMTRAPSVQSMISHMIQIQEVRTEKNAPRTVRKERKRKKRGKEKEGREREREKEEKLDRQERGRKRENKKRKKERKERESDGGTARKKEKGK